MPTKKWFIQKSLIFQFCTAFIWRFFSYLRNLKAECWKTKRASFSFPYNRVTRYTIPRIHTYRKVVDTKKLCFFVFYDFYFKNFFRSLLFEMLLLKNYKYVSLHYSLEYISAGYFFRNCLPFFIQFFLSFLMFFVSSFYTEMLSHFIFTHFYFSFAFFHFSQFFPFSNTHSFHYSRVLYIICLYNLLVFSEQKLG